MSNANALRDSGPFFNPAVFLDPAYNWSPNLTRVRRIGFLVYPNIEILDLCGPLDAFFYADQWAKVTGRPDDPGYESIIISAKQGPIKTMTGVQIMATHGLEDVNDNIDTLIVAGGIGVVQACADPTLVEWVRQMAPRSRRVASVCTGAFLLAAAGLLENRRVTTHWMYCDQLAATFPSLRVDPNLIFVRDGNVYTSGGITSGIDLALALVEEDLGRDASRLAAGTMVVFLRRPGGQIQFSPFLQAEAKNRLDIRQLQAWIVANLAANHTVENLADRVAMSPRNFARLFQSETGTTPGKFVERARVEAARCKLEQSNILTETLAASCGFGTPERMRRSFQKLLHVSPQDYRARFHSALGK
jgi:transcriptional regulator GlxA family with amidase domain